MLSHGAGGTDATLKLDDLIQEGYLGIMEAGKYVNSSAQCEVSVMCLLHLVIYCLCNPHVLTYVTIISLPSFTITRIFQLKDMIPQKALDSAHMQRIGSGKRYCDPSQRVQG